MTNPTIFIGSASEAKGVATAIATGLRETLNDSAEVVYWEEPEAFQTGNVLIQRLVEIAETTDFAVLLLSPTDRFGGEVAPNVLFELGLFMGQLEGYRTILVSDGAEPPSDLRGLLYLDLPPVDQDADPEDHEARTAQAVAAIAARVKSMGQRVNREIELAALERMLNVCTPAHEDHEAPHLSRLVADKNEEFRSAGDFFELCKCLLRRYVLGSIEPSAIEHLRLYFAAYLGDGVPYRLTRDDRVTVTRCAPADSANAPAANATFLIAVSNPRSLSDEDERLGSLLSNDWRLGEPIPGYLYDEFSEPRSTCAKAFADRAPRPGLPDDPWNRPTDNEAEVLAIPILWKHAAHVASIGVLAVSSENPDLSDQHRHVIQRLHMVANVLGVAADRLAAQIELDERPAAGIEIDPASDSRSFARRAVAMRQVIGEYAIADLVQRGVVSIEVSGDEHVVASRTTADSRDQFEEAR